MRDATIESTGRETLLLTAITVLAVLLFGLGAHAMVEAIWIRFAALFAH